MATIIRSHAADADAIDIWRYIARDNVDAADRLLDRLDRQIRLAAENPGIGRHRGDLVSGARSTSVGQYVIFFRPLPGEEVGIEVIRIIHSARDLAAQLSRPPEKSP